MKKLFLILFLIIPNFTFASEKIIWSKPLGNSIVWQQTRSGGILKYKNIIIDNYTGGFIDDAHMLCAYQGIRGTINIE